MTHVCFNSQCLNTCHIFVTTHFLLYSIYDGEYDIRFHETLPLTEMNEESTGELLIGFFHYYYHVFDKKYGVASVRTGEVLSKAKVWDRPKWWRFSIEDPFERGDHDLGVVLQQKGQDLILNEFKRALDLLENGNQTDVWKDSKIGGSKKGNNGKGRGKGGKGGGKGGGGRKAGGGGRRKREKKI